MEALIDFISNTPKPVVTNDLEIWGDHPISITMIAIIGTLIIVILVLILFMVRKKKLCGITNPIIISMPSMRELAAREVARDTALEKY